jgi:hypothetical protein
MTEPFPRSRRLVQLPLGNARVTTQISPTRQGPPYAVVGEIGAKLISPGAARCLASLPSRTIVQRRTSSRCSANRKAGTKGLDIQPFPRSDQDRGFNARGNRRASTTVVLSVCLRDDNSSLRVLRLQRSSLPVVLEEAGSSPQRRLSAAGQRQPGRQVLPITRLPVVAPRRFGPSWPPSSRVRRPIRSRR